MQNAFSAVLRLCLSLSLTLSRPLQFSVSFGFYVCFISADFGEFHYKISIEKSFPIFTQRHKRFATKWQATCTKVGSPNVLRFTTSPEPKCPLMSHILCAIPSTNSHNYLKFEFNSEKYLKTRQLIKLAFNSPTPQKLPLFSFSFPFCCCLLFPFPLSVLRRRQQTYFLCVLHFLWHNNFSIRA